MNDNTLKRLHISENNIINDFIDNNFETIKVNHIHPKHKKEKILSKYNKKPTLKQLERKIHNYFIRQYYQSKDYYNKMVINDIINNFGTHLVAEFKDYLIVGDESEFLQKQYNLDECKKYLPILFNYYKSCSIIFPNYVVLHESKYIFKNIRKKQKLIDNIQDQDDKQEMIKKGEIKIDESDTFFNSKAVNSILNQSNTSNLKLFFGINSKNISKDSEDTLNNIFEKIDKAENYAYIKKNYISKKKFKKILISDIENKTKSNVYNNANNIKVNKGNKERNLVKHCNLNSKFLCNNNKINDYKKNVENINFENKNKKGNENDKRNNHLKIIYSNKNKIEKSKALYKLNTSKRHKQSNTCIFETVTNDNKKNIVIQRNNSSNKCFKEIDSKNKLNHLKKKQKKKIIINKELIAKIMEKITNSKSAVFEGYNSFYTLNHTKFKLNRKENKKTNSYSLSISPSGKLHSYSKKKNYRDGIIINMNPSSSSPRINLLRKFKENNKESNIYNSSILNRNDKFKNKMIKVKSNLNFLPLNDMYSKRYLNNRKFNSNSKININDISYNNNAKNKAFITNNNNKNNNIGNKNNSKIKEKEKIRAKKLNLNIYKISQNSITQQYMINKIKNYEKIPNSSRAETISEIKPYKDIKFGRIKVVKKKKTIDSKKKILTDFKNNININININNSNIYNSNKVNKNSYSNSNIINNIFNNSISINNFFGQKRYIELNQSTFNTQRNDSQPLLKKLLLSSSNNNIFNSKNKFNMEKMNKSKANYYYSNNGYSTSRNSQNVSMIHNKIHSVGNANKKKSINSNTHKFKKELYFKMKKLLK